MARRRNCVRCEGLHACQAWTRYWRRRSCYPMRLVKRHVVCGYVAHYVPIDMAAIQLERSMSSCSCVSLTLDRSFNWRLPTCCDHDIECDLYTLLYCINIGYIHLNSSTPHNIPHPTYYVQDHTHANKPQIIDSIRCRLEFLVILLKLVPKK